MSENNEIDAADKYRPNNDAAREKPSEGITGPKTHIKQITDQASFAKPKLSQRFRSTFGGEDVKSTAGHVVVNVVLPTVKKLLFDMLTESAHRMIFGTSGLGLNRNGIVGTVLTANTAYNKMSSSPSGSSLIVGGVPTQQQQQISMTSPAFSVTDIMLPDRATAEAVRDALIECVDEWGSANVADLKNALGVTPEFTDLKVGWKSMGSSTIAHTADGVRLTLPSPRNLDN